MAPDSSEKADTFARLHPVLGLVPGLFVSRSRAEKATAQGTIALGEQDWQKDVFTFEGPMALNVQDLRSLQAVFILASRPDNDLEMEVAQPQSPITQALAAGLAFNASSPGITGRAKIVAASASSLASAGGYSTEAGGGRRNLTTSLTRLGGITVIRRSNGVEQCRSQLLAWTRMNPNAAGFGATGDTLALAISPLLSTPVLKGAKGGFIRLPQSEIDGLGDESKTACARVLHLRLSAIINHGTSKKLSAATLAEYAFGPVASKDTQRRQYQDVRDALKRFEPLGWTITADERRGADRIFTIGRPALTSKGNPKG